MKICIKMWMKTFHSHFYANFYEFLKGNPSNIYVKNAVQYQFSPILKVQMLFPQIQQAPGPSFRMLGKSLVSLLNYTG